MGFLRNENEFFFHHGDEDWKNRGASDAACRKQPDVFEEVVGGGGEKGPEAQAHEGDQKIKDLPGRIQIQRNQHEDLPDDHKEPEDRNGLQGGFLFKSAQHFLKSPHAETALDKAVGDDREQIESEPVMDFFPEQGTLSQMSQMLWKGRVFYFLSHMPDGDQDQAEKEGEDRLLEMPLS